MSPQAVGVLETLYDTHGDDCYRVAHGVIRDPQLAEDVVQEVFAAIWRGDAVFDDSRGSARTWILTVAHHKAVDAVRRNERHASRTTGTEALEWTPASDDVEQSGWQRTRRDHIGAALAGLSAVQRQTIMLAYLGGYSQSEIAQLTGTALGTVKTRSLHALRQLRKNLDLISIADAEGWLPRAV